MKYVPSSLPGYWYPPNVKAETIPIKFYVSALGGCLPYLLLIVMITSC